MPVQKGQNLIRCWEDKAENCVGAGKQRYKFCRAEKKIENYVGAGKTIENCVGVPIRDCVPGLPIRDNVPSHCVQKS